jgi:hypothetical protein|tara:strand:+ start:66 stop:215 length:150 start_codon:yes stop_codon:yes gene_type:complete
MLVLSSEIFRDTLRKSIKLQKNRVKTMAKFFMGEHPSGYQVNSNVTQDG